MYDNTSNEPVALNSLISRSHAYIRLLIEKSMNEGVRYSYHNGRKLTEIDLPERIVSQIFPYFLRLVHLEISNYYGEGFKGLKFHALKRSTGIFHMEVSIIEEEVKDQLEYFSFISYVFNAVFLKNNFNNDISLLTKAQKFI
ncbi:TPA: hypothetical protein MW242_001886 [Acinetobacter baumannii]|nr:hypothetical protein [Acinetobacter baumannii]